MSMAAKKKRASREDRQVRAQHRRDQKSKMKQALTNEDGDFYSLQKQLQALGLALREIEGDGNCLFRAFSDQLTGSSDRHKAIRQEVVDYMRANRDDFEPFLVEDESFDRHLELLSEDSTFGGNDSIVAFSRLYNATVAIHQLNEPLWQVKCESGKDANQPKDQMEIHISYHNGDHYNSVRRADEDRQSISPAKVKLKVEENGQRSLSTDESSNHDDVDKEEALVHRVLQLSDTQDACPAMEVLELNGFNVDAAAQALKQGQTGTRAEKKDPTLWQPGGTGSRIFGEEVAQAAQSSQSKRNDRLAQIQEKLKVSQSLSNKQRQRLKREERKLASMDRKKNEVASEAEVNSEMPTLQALTI